MDIKSKCFLVDITRINRYSEFWDCKLQCFPKIACSIKICHERIFYYDSIQEVRRKTSEIIKEEENCESNSRKKYCESDYNVQVEKLNYIVLEEKSAFELTKKVNKHLEKGWEALGGIQIAGAGGDSSECSSWSKWRFVQSLVCCD